MIIYNIYYNIIYIIIYDKNIFIHKADPFPAIFLSIIFLQNVVSLFTYFENINSLM